MAALWETKAPVAQLPGGGCPWENQLLPLLAATRTGAVSTAEIQPWVFFALHICSSWLFPCKLFSQFLTHFILQRHADHLVNGPTNAGIEQKYTSK